MELLIRCHICDTLLAEVQYNADFKDFEPCGVCLAVIKETVGGFTDRPTAAEDDFGGPDVLFDELYPSSYDPFTQDN